MRLASVALVLVGAVADAAGEHALAYYALVAAVPTVALAALSALGDVLDGTAALGADRAGAVLTALALPFVLLATAVRAPLIAEGPPPAIGVTAVVVALGLFAVQALVAVTASAPRRYPATDTDYSGRLAAASRARSIRGSTRKNEPTVTAIDRKTALWSSGSRGGEPPAIAGRSSAAGRM